LIGFLLPVLLQLPVSVTLSLPQPVNRLSIPTSIQVHILLLSVRALAALKAISLIVIFQRPTRY